MKTRFIKKIQKAFFNFNIISNIVRFSFALLLILAFVFPTLAQDQTTKRGFTPGNSYALGDLEIINTTNGNMMIRFPLGQLPAGRNGLTTGAYLTYNSKLFDTDLRYFRNESYQCTYSSEEPPIFISCPTYTKNFLKVSDEGGWQLSSGYGLKMENRLLQYSNVPQGQQPQCTNQHGGAGAGHNIMSYIHQLYVTFPDGSKHEMIPYGFTDAESDRYFNVRYDGTLYDCATGWSRTGYPMTYYTVDGTYVRMEVSYDSDYDFNNNTWNLYFPDGTRYESATGKIYDRNNNYIDFDGGQITDQFGRSIVAGNDSQTNEQTFTVKGVGGEDLVWRVKWKNIVVNRKYKAYAEDLLGCGATQSCPSDTDPETFAQTLSVVDKITLPSQAGENMAYIFHYNAPDATGGTPTEETVGWGELSGITMPSGAETEYSYFLDNKTIEDEFMFTSNVLKNKITEKTLTYDREYDGNSTETTETWGYDIYDGGGATITAPDGGVTSEEVGYTGSANWKSGLSLRTIMPDGTKVEKLWAQNYPIACTGGLYCDSNAANPYVKTEFVSIKDSSGNYTLTAIKDYNYDKNGNVIQVAEYDWVSYSSVPRSGIYEGSLPTGIPSEITPKRITVTGYYAETPEASQTTVNGYTYIYNSSPLLRNAPAWSEVRDGSNQAVTRTEMDYDYPLSKGNLTESRSWDSTKGSYSNPLTTNNSISGSTTYNSYGMPLTTTDARGTVTQITYGEIEVPNDDPIEDLYPTQVITAYNTSVQKTAQMEYDFYTGAVTTATDVDNNVSTVTTYDDLGRPTLVEAANGTSVEVQTETEYNDEERFVIVRSDLNTTGDKKRVSIQHYDQLGRVRLTRTLEDSTTQSATNEQHGIKVQTRYLASGSCTTFTGNCSYALSSNPYRAATSSATTNEPTMGWTRSKTNNKGQTIEIETFSGATLPYPFLTSGDNQNSTGIVKTDYDADRVLVTDQAGKQRISKTNGLGQLTDVWEVRSQDGSNTVAISFPNHSEVAYGYQTSYQYDTLSNLTEVNQGVQERAFTYSSLSRLLSATNPESGTITYTYDNGGNLLTKKDARNIKTTYTYDQLSRVLTRSYELCPSGQSCQSEGTPSVTYTYDDTNVDFGIGKLTKVSSSVSETAYTEFDELGRVLSSKQTTSGLDVCTGTTAPCVMTYTYNLAGGLVSQTYPSGREVTNSFDNDGSLTNVSSKANSTATPRTYANSFIYNAAGAVESMRLGNGRFESTSFNARLQPTQISLGTSANNTSLLKLAYDYGTTSNNGNVQSQTITVPGMSHPLIQTYSYDALSRLLSAEEKSNNVTQWKQTFSYDKYGNKRFDTSSNNTTTLPENFDPDIYNPTFDTANNRMADNQGYEYDAAGNVIEDASGKRFAYDGENKQKSFGTNGSNNNGGSYYYDGDGKRVKKIVGEETTIFVYNASGQMVAEYSTTTVTNPTISYLTSDTLGSPRINTNASGQVQARHDYMPFGEEIVAGESYSGGRTTTQGYPSLNNEMADGIRNKFTAYERDNETDLDYAKSRMYGYSFGRFTSPDDFLNDTHVSDPQSWNLYVYVRNNPLLYIDPTGKIREKNGKVETKDRKEDDPQVIQIKVGDSTKSYFLPTGGEPTEINGKKYVITWEAKKVWVFADNGDKIKAYQAKGDIQLIELKTDDKGKATGTLLDVKQSSGILGGAVDSSDLPLSNATNCHGTTFAKGQVWIDNLEVGKVLKGDGYRTLAGGEKAQVNDAGLYSQDDGGGTYYAHSVRVNSVNTQGVVDVTSKGGITRRVIATPGPGRGTAWQGNPTTKLEYFTQRTKQ